MDHRSWGILCKSYVWARDRKLHSLYTKVLGAILHAFAMGIYIVRSIFFLRNISRASLTIYASRLAKLKHVEPRLYTTCINTTHHICTPKFEHAPKISDQSSHADNSPPTRFTTSDPTHHQTNLHLSPCNMICA